MHVAQPDTACITRRSCFLPCPHKSRFYEYHEPDKYGNAVETVTIN